MTDFDDEGRVIVPEATQGELDTLHTQLTMLNTAGQGVSIDKLRVFYPGVGWGVIVKRIAALEQAGRVTKAARGKMGIEFYAPVEA